MIDAPSIRFKHRAFADLRSAVLTGDRRESFAVLLAKRNLIGKTEIFTVRDIRLPRPSDYLERKTAFLRLGKEFTKIVLAEVVHRMDVDTLIDVHTHPFAIEAVCFSAVDDHDERCFTQFLGERFENIYYASIVFSQRRYQARIWTPGRNCPQPVRARIRTQTCLEYVPETGEDWGLPEIAEESLLTSQEAVFNRSALALGLDAMRTITSGQTVALAGVGGLGSIAAEHLIHLGFHRLVLIDPDTLELSNMNRFVGATMAQAQAKVKKVEAVRDHLTAINPEAQIVACALSVEDEQALELMAGSDWILLSTDNHGSRLEVQRLALRCFVPMIAAGVNITVANGAIRDMSGEVIAVRAGDRRCLNCLGRIDLAKIAAESHPDPAVRSLTVQKGYVTGMAVKEPAVKTLNAIVASMAVERLLDHYVPDRRDVPILVYENNDSRAIYEDRMTMESRNASGCALCDV